MGLFSKKIELYAPVSGELKSIEDSNDSLFSSKAMGDGFMIIPKSNEIYSPVTGKVVSVFPTKHAITIKKGKMEYLLHLGIDTVELEGKGFDIKVKANDTVGANTLIGNVDFNFIKSQNKSTDVIFICTNLTEKQHVKLDTVSEVKHSEIVGSII